MAVAIAADIARRAATTGAEKMITKASQDVLLKAVGEQLAKRLSSKVIGKVIQFVGPAVAAIANFTFIEGYGQALLAITSEEFDKLISG